jgi:Tti2 family
MKHIKPIFRANPHPMLNLESGRKLPRTAGGYAAAQDPYEGQVWKEHPGIGNVLLWCVQRINVCAYILVLACAELRFWQTDAYERLWYLVVPPMMTLLDDFEAMYKLLGIRVVNAMLERAPLPLLNRTGVSELILSV